MRSNRRAPACKLSAIANLGTETRPSRYTHMLNRLHGWVVLGAAGAMLSGNTACGETSRVSRATPSSLASASSTPTGVGASPSPRTQAGLPAAIMVHQDESATYRLALVGANGSIVAKANPRVPSHVNMTFQNCAVFGSNTPLPTCQRQFWPRGALVTSSNTRAYYLDGDSDVGYLTPDGRTGNAVHLPANPRIRYAVAVSPDDSRIAVSAFDYPDSAADAKNPGVKLSIFVQDLAGGNRVDLFSSTSVTEWPIGWHDGHLIIAVGPAGFVQYASDNPYYAEEYHVADARTGDRLATIGADCLDGPLVRSGAPCMLSRFQVLGYRSWDGVEPAFAPQPDPVLQPLALAPNGSRLAGSIAGPPTNAHLDLVSASGISVLDVKGILQGWLDDEHLVYFQVGSNHTWILDVVTGKSSEVQDTNPPGLPDAPRAYLQFLGTVPQQMS